MVPPQIAELLTASVAKYIERSRRKYVQKAIPLASEKQASLASFFAAEILSAARTAAARPRLLNPAFYAKVRSTGIKRLPDFANVAAITFVDVIVHQAPLTDDLLFHELVHFVQYQHLGLREFARLYVKGFLEAGSYEAIPLERQAYDLDARYSAAPRVPFSVDNEVKQAVESGFFANG